MNSNNFGQPLILTVNVNFTPKADKNISGGILPLFENKLATTCNSMFKK
jgi:hypothetical protein